MEDQNNTLQEHDLQVEKIYLNYCERAFCAATIEQIGPEFRR
jgi:hypothetical protein